MSGIYWLRFAVWMVVCLILVINAGFVVGYLSETTNRPLSDILPVMLVLSAIMITKFACEKFHEYYTEYKQKNSGE